MRRTSRTLSFVVALSVLASTLSPKSLNLSAESPAFALASQVQSSQKAPIRRALLIPISRYDTVLQRSKPAQSKARSSPAEKVAATGTKEILGRLEGPPNDVKELAALLKARYGFTYVHILPEAEATHDGILKAIQKYLIDDAAPGDECLLYYGGHGSFIRNSKSNQPNKQQETLVPIDYIRPMERREEIRDILDWELKQVFNRALDKGIVLTFISDSCHSGSLARGETAFVSRAAPGSKFDLAEEPPQMADPKERGLLHLSASLAEQSAYEKDYNNIRHGIFTRALLDVMTSQPVETLTAQLLFQQVEDRVRRRRDSLIQDPTINANEDRRQRNLFGSPVPPHATRPIFVVSKFNRETKDFTLDRGRAFGLTAGSVLVKQGDPAPEAEKARLEVTIVLDMNSSRAKPVRPADLSKIKVGDVFVQETWATSAESVSVWLPPANLSLARLRAVVQALAPLRKDHRVRVVDDPTEQFVSHIISYDGAVWRLSLPSGEFDSLGASPTAESVIKKIGASSVNKLALFVNLPLASELRRQIQLGPGTPNGYVNLARAESAANYLLVGRAFGEGERIEYAWVLAGAFKNETETERRAHQDGRLLSAPKPAPLPPITDWVAIPEGDNGQKETALDLEDLALELNKIYGWVNTQSPPGATDREGAFPYRLTIFDSQWNPVDPLTNSNAWLIEGAQYQVALIAAPSARQRPNTEKRWVYVLTIDKNGKITLLYPKDFGIENQFPKGGVNAPQLGRETLTPIDVVGPATEKGAVLGPETYIMLATNEKLPDPKTLESEGVRNRVMSGVRGRKDRPAPPPEPTKWLVQHLFLESKPK